MYNKMVARANPDEGKKEMSHQGQERASQEVQWYRICRQCGKNESRRFDS